MIRRESFAWGVQLSAEPAPDMKLVVNIRKGTSGRNPTVQVVFDGTPIDGWIGVGDANTWMNVMRSMLDQSREVVAEMKA